MSTLIGRLLVGTKLDPSGFKSGARQSNKHLTSFNQRVRKVSGQVAKNLGAMGAAFAFGTLVQNAANTISEFDQKVANLAATTGQSKSNIGALVQNAKEVGSVSAFSASEVLSLQTELAKLGNTESEIISMTKAVGDFSIAVGATAADAATFTGGVLKSFGKSAEQTESVVNSLAVATTKSALDFNKLNVALPIVGTAAAEFGFGIEKTTSLLGVLADRNIDASTSGTALRNIFLKLKEKGLTYNEAMDRINNSTDSLNEANELFGVRGAIVATVLAKSQTQADRLEQSITGVDGALKKMTDERLDTIQGKITLLTSAWEGLVIQMDSGSGAASRAFKGSVGALTSLISNYAQIGSIKESVIFTIFGSDEEREKLNKDLKEQKRLQDEIVKTTQNNNADIASSLGFTVFEDAIPLSDDLTKAIDELNKKSGKLDEDGGAKVLSFSEKIGKLENEISTLSESYIQGGSSNSNLIDSIISKQGKIDTLNKSLEKSAALMQRISEGVAPGASRGSIDGVQSILGGDRRMDRVNGIGESSTENVKIDNDYIQRSIEYTDTLAEATTNLSGAFPPMAVSAANAMNALGAALESGAASFAEFAGNILKGIQQVIGGLIKQTVANAVSSVFQSLPFPANLAAAGLVGSLASGIFNTALNGLTAPKLAEGGIIRKPTLAMVGEYPGAATNPEIVAPESKLRNIFGSELARGGGGGRMFSVTKGSDIYTSQDKYNYRLNRTG